MKLICELAETVEYELIEEEGKPKKYYIEGIFMQSEKKNKMEEFIHYLFLKKKLIDMLKNT